MSAHRFQKRLTAAAESESNIAFASPAFVPFPSFPAAILHVSNIQEIYRLAAERTREQLKPQRSREPRFSLN